MELSYSKALAILLTIHQVNLCKLYIQAYHRNSLVATSLFGEGFPNVSFLGHTESRNVLYKIKAVTSQKIIFTSKSLCQRNIQQNG